SDLPALASRYGPAAVGGARALLALIDDLHGRVGHLAPAPLLDLALERSGYRTWLGGQPDGSARLGHLATLRTLAARAEGDLGTWLADLQLGEPADSSAEDTGRVLLTTIHGAKGGEWRVVFVVGVEEGLLPHGRSLVASSPEGADIDE